MNGPHPPQITTPQKKNPQFYAQMIGDTVRSLSVILFWLVVASAVIASTLLALRVVIFLYHLAIAAIEGGIR